MQVSAVKSSDTRNTTSGIPNPDNTIIVNGDGRVSVVPNIAVIRLGVQTDGENLTELQGRNAEISQMILQALETFDIVDIRTGQISLSLLNSNCLTQRRITLKPSGWHWITLIRRHLPLPTVWVSKKSPFPSRSPKAAA